MNINYNKPFFLFVLISFFTFNLSGQTSIEKNGDKWSLLVDGQLFKIKGATFGYDKDVQNYEHYFKDLQSIGVNTIRTWATGKNTSKLLDAAHKYDIKIMMGIWMRHGRPGYEDDDSFNYLEENAGKQYMYDNAIEIVEKYKSHPAVLTWTIGNEVYLNMATDPEKEAYSKFLEKICSDIKKADSTHPIVSVDAWTFGLDWWQKYVPSIDIYGLNSYGAGVSLLSQELIKRKIDKPYIVTEFGVTGEWDIKTEKNGIKFEPTDQEKYDAIATGYHDWIDNKSNCLGVYVFHYADGSNFISPWLFTHHNGMKRPQYWALREAYTGQKPTNNVPIIEEFELPNSEIKSDVWVPVTLKVSDIENDRLDVSFYYNQRTGSRKRRDQINKLNFRGNLNDGFEIQLPKENGAIKIYANVNDSFNNLGIASTSIIVIDDEAKNKKYLVPKKQLPFYVYKDGIENPYSPSAHMGNYKVMTVDIHNQEDVQSGTSAIKISYNQEYDWYGVGFVDPANDWGDILGGYDISGAKKFSFWAKASKEKVVATIGFGLIDKNKAFPDTAKKSIEIMLTTRWKKYSLKTKNLDLSCIRSGLTLFSSANNFPQDIYIDNIVFE
jgi:hypothetical protein